MNDNLPSSPGLGPASPWRGAFVIGCFLWAVAVACAPAAGEGKTYPVSELPGCKDLPQRMAAHYEPVKVAVKPDAPQYDLPLDLGKLTNAGFAKGVYPVRDKALAGKANSMLKAKGFAVLAGGRIDDVARFYKNLKVRGVPIFITSDSLLHLYHIQFGETLRDIEQRQFAADALAISKALQAEAIKLHAASAGKVKDAARLLVGFTTVPTVLLSRTDLSAEAAEALKEVASWPARVPFRRRMAFMEKYGELMEVLRKAQAAPRRGPRPMRRPNLGYDAKATRAALEAYLKAHPVKKAPDAKLIPAFVAKDVRAELDLIAAHAGFRPSPLFGYKEDYSQYVPRGHYTRSKVLKQYFKALMWYGRMTFLIRGKAPGVEGLVPLAEAEKQTRAACCLAAMLEGKLPDGRSVAEVWDRLYAVTAYYVGLADDLTPYEYRRAIREGLGTALPTSALADDNKLFAVRAKLAQMRKPAIYSGTGDLEGPPAHVADEKTLAKALGATQGMRLMGQRYIPDSYMMGQLVYPTVGPFTGGGTPFTMVVSDGGRIRGFPRGLDVMAVLGSARAREWIKTGGDDQYQRYDATLAKLKTQFGKIDQAGWNRNMYWSWLHALQALLAKPSAGYPTFMQSDAWRDKQLAAAIGSWAQLRHDTILYAKQSYTMMATGMPPRPKMVEGYVEPVPEFYARLLALTRMTAKGLEEFKVLDEKSRGRLKALEGIVERLLKISQAELAGKKLDKDDYAFIRSFGDRLKYVVAGVNKQGTQTTIVADVHTDGNTRQCLEEGTGFLHSMIVVYPMPDGGRVAGVGPILSHYEFKQPMSNRLTDEAWRKRLLGGDVPPLPDWAKPFTIAPTPREEL